ncbi:MAG: hypothetical protein HYT76_00510 [Deltaproteobacteria bacterium]|nr:hypothetical protein [Deltaproteobacteria bacterium]
MSSSSLIKAITVTFGTNMLADLASDRVLHPGYKLDYGLLNPLLGRDMYEPFWGTRLQHLVGIAGSLTLTEHVSSSIFSFFLRKAKILKATEDIFKIHKTPLSYLLHNFISVFLGVFIYCSLDALFNPLYKKEGERMETWEKTLLPTVAGTPWALIEPVLGYGLKKAFTPWAWLIPHASLTLRQKTSLWVSDLLIPDIAIYGTIKGFGWHEYADYGLTDSELKLNRIYFERAKPKTILY